ncbi:molybdate ABC transporter permease subunit [Aeromicrobium sp. 636]|uniref:Molybdenum transport system permease n=2 Tax=Nocardioidaceae TaxID=85015 RepID=A0A8I0ESR7_9ACTN|nr:ABC transporter permease [Aeromicrobium senzhongii]MBC9224727.1 molybdate ABC transporter permease subunit [Aeromicrobium senzhongii]MCQ3996840.1 molybdate ABC transporter permease subunit [Aeromicrobium sp. 636]
MVPALVGLALLVLPVAGLVLRVEWRDFLSLVTTEESRAALGLSLRTAVASTALCVVLGVPLALALARSSARWASVVRALVLLPLVLPPVVGGIALLATFGRRGWLGQHLEAFGIEIAFTTVAVVLAQTFVSLPFLVVTLEGALRAVDPGYADVAATLGAAPSRVLTRVSLPLVAPGLIAGTVLSFARALGEFGATVTFAGSLQGVTRALPTEIYLQREVNPDAAIALSFLLVAVALVVIALVHRPGRSPW